MTVTAAPKGTYVLHARKGEEKIERVVHGEGTAVMLRNDYRNKGYDVSYEPTPDTSAPTAVLPDEQRTEQRVAPAQPSPANVPPAVIGSHEPEATVEDHEPQTYENTQPTTEAEVHSETTPMTLDKSDAYKRRFAQLSVMGIEALRKLGSDLNKTLPKDQRIEKPWSTKKFHLIPAILKAEGLA